MNSQPLDNLCKTGSLKAEAANQRELDGLLRSAKARLTDAGNPALAIESRFEVDEQLVSELISCATLLQEKLRTSP